MYKVKNHQCRDCLTDFVYAGSNDPARSRLRSAAGTNISVPRIQGQNLATAFICVAPFALRRIQKAPYLAFTCNDRHPMLRG